MIGPLLPGCKIEFRGRQWLVACRDDAVVQLEGYDGEQLALTVADLVSEPGFKLLEGVPLRATGLQELLSNLPPDELKRVRELEPHFNEVETGFRSGFPEIALPGEPRDEYNVETTTLQARLHAKVAELDRLGIGRSFSWMEKRYRRFLTDWIVGLADEKKLRESRALAEVDERVREVIDATITPLRVESRKRFKTVCRLVKAALREHPDAPLPVPSNYTLHKLIKATLKRNAFAARMATTRSRADGPSTPFRRFRATRPGEVVLIDSTPIDVVVLGASGLPMRVELIFALDLYTRTCVAWYFAAGAAKTVDAIYMLYRMLTPKRIEPHWPHIARWSYPGVPDTLLINLLADCGKSEGDVAGIPVVVPEHAVIDHGKIFISGGFRRALGRIGCDLWLARFRTPTDKPQVERVFLTAALSFFERQQGHKGSTTSERGHALETRDLLFLPQLEEKFAYWLATIYHNTPHSSLTPGILPELQAELTALRRNARRSANELDDDYRDAVAIASEFMSQLQYSPNEMYGEGLARAGFNARVVDRSFVLDLLPVEWRAIDKEGVRIDKMLYDAEVLNPYRGLQSTAGGKNAGKWPFRVDPNDRSRIWLCENGDEEGLGTWHEIPLVSSDPALKPFSDISHKHMRELIRAAADRVATRAEVARAEDEMYAEMLRSLNNRRKTVRVADLETARAAAAVAMHGLPRNGSHAGPDDDDDTDGVLDGDAVADGIVAPPTALFEAMDLIEEDPL